MVKISTEVPPELARQMERFIKEGWFPNQDALLKEALLRFVEGKSFLGDSPQMLHRFAADAINESKPDTALKFVNRGLTLLSAQKTPDLILYQSMVELRVQTLLIMGRNTDAMSALEEAKEKLPNSPNITKWITKVKRAAEKAG
jgi:hypothetical protein